VNIIVTGASDGIGYQLSRLLNAPDTMVLLVGKRDAVNIKASLSANQHYISADLTSELGVSSVAEKVVQLGWDDIDLLIHNAGIGWVGDSKDQPWNNIDKMLSLNCLAPISLTHRLMPYLKKAQGKVVFIGSSATHRRCPSFSVYAASKAAIAGFVRSLRIELQNELSVQLIHPGPTKTGMHAKAGLKKHWIQMFFRKPDSVAREIIWAISSNRETVNVGSLRYRIRCLSKVFYKAMEWLKPVLLLSNVFTWFKRTA